MLADSFGDAEPLLFSRGFLLWPASLDRPAVLDRLNWNESVSLPGGWHLAFSHLLGAAPARDGHGYLVVLGGGVATDIRTADAANLAAWLASAGSEDQFQERFDAISGRFAVLRVGDDGQVRVQNDAQGLRAVFHSESSYPPVVGSHAHLVGEVVQSPPNAFARPEYHAQTNLRTPPGRHTTRHGVLALVPNTELELTSRQVRRVYPRAQRIERPTSDVLPLLEHELCGTLDLLVSSGQPVVTSLSAGLDSRLTLALLRKHLARVRFFTYDVAGVNNKANQYDTADALALVSMFDLDHILIDVQGSAPAEIRKVLAANRHRAHSPPLAVSYREVFPENAIHLRSNGNGTLTAWYQRGDWPDSRVSPEYRMQLASQGKCFDLGVLDAFTDAWQATDAYRVEELGHSGLDFAYAEDRMGVWHQNIVQESDIAFETRVPFGSRRLIDLVLSAPLPDRRNGAVFVDLIRRLWPELLRVPINGITVPVDGPGGLWADPPPRGSRAVLSRREIVERSR